jgi:acetyl-CoA carboxylase biotin carboxyl carrier protein
MDWKQLKELIDLVSEKGFTEFEVERQGFRLKITQNTSEHAPPCAQPSVQPGTSISTEINSGSVQPPSAGSSSPGAQPSVTVDRVLVSEVAAESLHIVSSPIVGTFYRSPSPTSEPFVKVGDRVEPDAVVCIIEAMKLMNEIQAETSGTIAEVYVENGQPVEYNQPLFGVRT